MTTFADLAGRRVGVWGVGVEGTATLRRLASDGIEPAVVVESGWSPELLTCDLVVKSPGISRRLPEAQALVEAGVELAGGLGLWLAGTDRTRVLCVTGTKGKSTTTSIAGQLARGLGADVGVGGNLGSAPWDPDTAPFAWWVIETSSYQATDVVLGPRVVAVTSLAQDHLTWHGGYPAYVADKLSLATRPGVETVVIPEGDPELEAHAALLGPHVLRVPFARPAWVERLGLLGEHNLRNALVARAALVALGVPGADDDAALEAATAGFEPLPSRLTLVGRHDGVDFVDDGLSTNVLATLAAVDAFPGRRIALLVGGHDRGIDYTELGRGLADRDGVEVQLFAMPASGPRIAAAVRASAPGVRVTECPDLETAVAGGARWAAPGGVVLLSPAAPSFGRYRDYRDRGEHFARLVADLARG